MGRVALGFAATGFVTTSFFASGSLTTDVAGVGTIAGRDEVQSGGSAATRRVNPEAVRD